MMDGGVDIRVQKLQMVWTCQYDIKCLKTHLSQYLQFTTFTVTFFGDFLSNIHEKII